MIVYTAVAIILSMIMTFIFYCIIKEKRADNPIFQQYHVDAYRDAFLSIL